MKRKYSIKVSQECLKVTLSKSGKFILNKASHTALGAPNAITYHFDRQHRAVAIKASTQWNRHSFVIKRIAQNHSYEATAKKFCSLYRISYSRSAVFNAIFLDGMLVLELVKDKKEKDAQ